MTILFDLRLLGAALKNVPISEMLARVQPLMFAGFAVMVMSGTLLFASDPVRFYGNVFFRIKIVMMLLAGVNAGVFALATAGDVADWSLQPRPPFKARLAGAASLSLWGGVVVAGRLIAYNWFN